MEKLLKSVIIIFLSCGLFTSCKKDKGDPPVLPPYETMVIDFTNFESQKKSAVTNVEELKGTETSTWEFAAAISGIWSSLIETNCTVPLASFDAASGSKPAYVSEDIWQWSYGFQTGGVSYKARIKGQISSSSVVWKMYVTKEGSGGYTDFLWVEGTSDSDGSNGQWTIYQSPQSAVTLFRIDWTKSGDLVTVVKYNYIKNDSNKDSYITYSVTTGTLDRSYKVYFSSGLYSISDIEWNATTKNGRLKCVDYLLDDNWYCWDSNKINVLCE